MITFAEGESTISENMRIPDWIKDNAKWWSTQQIPDSDFVLGLEYLLEQKILSVPTTMTNDDSTGQDIPNWIKTNARWWADGQISDSDFVKAIQYLIEKNILKMQFSSDNLSSVEFSECNEISSVSMVSPISLDEIEFIVPMGRVSGSHVTPTDHQYWIPIGVTHETASKLGTSAVDPNRFSIVSPADGVIKKIERFSYGDYRIVIEHSCSVSTIFIHVDTLEESILNETNFDDTTSHQHVAVNIPVQKGQTFGSIGYHSFDFSVVDYSKELSGFIIPQHYDGEPWKIHTMNPTDYFEEPSKLILLEKSLRTTEPIDGKIDYDLDGKLVGNWFEENNPSYSSDAEPYWKTHLSIVYDHIDPSQIRISFGDYQGESKQFGVNENKPLPDTVSVKTGLVKYELVNFDYYSTTLGYYGESHERWDRMNFVDNLSAKNDNQVVGTVLMKLLDDEKLQVEVFPNKRATQVHNFSDSASIYLR